MAALSDPRDSAPDYSLTVGVQSPWRVFWSRFKRRRPAMIGSVVLLIILVAALFAPLVAPYEPGAQNLLLRFARPLTPHPDGGWYLFGGDNLGRDVLTRVLYGGRISIQVGFVAQGVSLLIGVLIGALAGFYGRWVDSLLMRLADIFLSVPDLMLLIAVVAVFQSVVPKGKEIYLLMGVLGVLGWPTTARLVRGEILSIKERDFVEAARSMGARDLRIIWKHVLPNVIPPIIVTATLGVGGAILSEAALSYLGLGIQPPIPSWGNMIMSGQPYLRTAWWLATFPGLVTMACTLCLYLVGDGLREALDPRVNK